MPIASNAPDSAWMAVPRTLLLWQIKRMDMEARSLSQDKSKQLLSKVRHFAAATTHPHLQVWSVQQAFDKQIL